MAPPEAVAVTEQAQRGSARGRTPTTRRRNTGPGRPASPAARMVGGLGELFITLGVLLGLFVVWQLWWTDVEGTRAAASIVSQFEESLPDSPEVAGTPQQGDPPAAVAVGNAQRFGTLLVPDWGPGYEVPIAEGVGRSDVLDVGPVGHYPSTAMPGQVGNFALAGHRQTYGKPFFAIDTLSPGEALIVQTAAAWYVYRVTGTEIVSPDDVGVVAAVPGDPAASPTERMITLTTCHPLWSTAERYVVHGVLDYWVDRADGRPAELIDAGGA